MRLLLVGGGGREHALAWSLSKNKHVKQIICAPGNGGTAVEQKCTNVQIKASDVDALVDFANNEGIDLVIVGPEEPLAKGLVDKLLRIGVPVFGPVAKAALIESKKAWAKCFMKRHGIPTASFQIFNDASDAIDYVKAVGAPIVVKASGLASGKGVVVAKSVEEAIAAVERIMIDRAFGDAGSEVVIEEALSGWELSALAFVDGNSVALMPPAQDNKRLFDDDQGPNTGGMGAYAPVPMVDEDLMKEVEERILMRCVQALRSEGVTYKGVIYAGLMITSEGPKVLEFNCRFGDPEAQAILPLLDDEGGGKEGVDLLEVIRACVDGSLNTLELKWCNSSACCVVVASRGYPEKPEVGKPVLGLEKAAKMRSILIFHAGTALKDGKFFTSGGRVLNVVGVAPTLAKARGRAYSAAQRIYFEGMHYRRDIAAKALSA